jgi:Arc/MetJ family transcription regulator
MGRINIEVDDDLHRQVKSVCALQAINLREFVNDALRAYVKKRGG